jgi:nicotinamide-nucleotide amidase
VTDELAHRVIRKLRSAGATVAVAESLTGGLVIARLVDVPGASEVVLGGVVTYATQLKARLLGVDEGVLDEAGPVQDRVAAQMAERVRELLAVDGRPADFGLATTGVAGPEAQDGHPPGEVFIAVADAVVTTIDHLVLAGDRNEVRAQVVELVLSQLDARLPDRGDGGVE